MSERKTPDGSLLRILGEPPSEPVLQVTVFPQGGKPEKRTRCVLRAEDRAWLREQLARFEPIPPIACTELARVTPALQKLAAIADAYDANELDVARPEWKRTDGGSLPPEKIELHAGRGGKTLFTLADAFAARDALKGAEPEALPGSTVCGYRFADGSRCNVAKRECRGHVGEPCKPPSLDEVLNLPKEESGVVRAIRCIMQALDAWGGRADVEGERMDRAREAVAALTATTPAPTKGNQIEVLYNGLWHVCRIIRDEDACWRVQVLQPPLPDSDITWPSELTVWKANTLDWRTLDWRRPR